MGLIMLPLVLPEIIVAVSLLVVLLGLRRQPVDLHGDPGHVLICTPFCIAILNGLPVARPVAGGGGL
jgi:spermidine/putrescine transport system permease protein